MRPVQIFRRVPVVGRPTLMTALQSARGRSPDTVPIVRSRGARSRISMVADTPPVDSVRAALAQGYIVEAAKHLKTARKIHAASLDAELCHTFIDVAANQLATLAKAARRHVSDALNIVVRRLAGLLDRVGKTNLVTRLHGANLGFIADLHLAGHSLASV